MYVSLWNERCDGPVFTELFDKVGVLGSIHAYSRMHVNASIHACSRMHVIAHRILLFSFFFHLHEIGLMLICTPTRNQLARK